MELPRLGGHVQVGDELQGPVDVPLLTGEDDLAARGVGENGEAEDRASRDFRQVGQVGGDNLGGCLRDLHRPGLEDLVGPVQGPDEVDSPVHVGCPAGEKDVVPPANGEHRDRPSRGLAHRGGDEVGGNVIQGDHLGDRLLPLPRPHLSGPHIRLSRASRLEGHHLAEPRSLLQGVAVHLQHGDEHLAGFLQGKGLRGNDRNGPLHAGSEDEVFVQQFRHEPDELHHVNILEVELGVPRGPHSPGRLHEGEFVVLGRRLGQGPRHHEEQDKCEQQKFPDHCLLPLEIMRSGT
ncbi:hypothetical protein SDC9_67313 [bioreactor metagenome]|uniref:Uncharacterized protein n=1 Tax=bioreactor metagenome TaxID=1076179 RepID=A0A644XXG9_9ZZZZ